jgi:hypothetical protein
MPLGRLANAELREYKKAAHVAFDTLWKSTKRKGYKSSHERSLAYAWLAEELKIHPQKCHIGMMDVDQCRAVIEVCKKYGMEGT